MGEDSKALTGKVQAQVKEKAKEAIGNLLKNSTKSGDLKLKVQDVFWKNSRDNKRSASRKELTEHLIICLRAI